jgi:hypothetical protein
MGVGFALAAPTTRWWINVKRLRQAQTEQRKDHDAVARDLQ